MTSKDDNNIYCQWRIGVWRVMGASWAAAYLSYGLNADEVTVLSEYYSLLSNCLANIAVAEGEGLISTSDS